MPKDKDFLKRSKLYHHYLDRSGGYKFMWKNLFKLIGVLVVFAAVVWFISAFLIDFDHIMCNVMTRFPDWVIIGTLFLSESFTGILSPDVFILWGKAQPNGNTMVFILALVSYTGGVISYSYGRLLYRIPKVKFWVREKFQEQFKLIKKFGGLLIFLSTLTPLPYSPVSVVAGVIKFPLKWYLFLSLARFARFYLYAYLLYSVVQSQGPC